MTESSEAVFLSYASQDAEAAKRICEALRAAGIEVWFDQSELRGGDVWDRQIRKQIQDCALFIPIISANTQARSEGYFRLEWKLAVDRSHLMAAERPFLIPIVVDATDDAAALVPDKFREVQWTRMLGVGTSRDFVQRVQTLLAAGAHVRSKPVFSTSSATARPSAPRRSKTALFASLAVLGALAGYLAIDRGSGTKRGVNATTSSGTLAPGSAGSPAFTPAPRSVAVLPFTNLSGDATQDYFSDGVSEELLDSLSRLSELAVAARTSSFSFRNQTVDVATIARRLNVGFVLEGSVRKSGSTVRITVQLINALTGFHVWSETYDRQLSDILKVQTDVATSVARYVQGRLVGNEAAIFEMGGTQNAEAYDFYLRGMGERDPAALADFDRAIAVDPNYALAYSARAWELHSLATLTTLPSDRVRLRVDALQAAERAVALAPNLGEPHAILASIRAYAMFDYAGAAPEFQLARQLAPGNARVQRNFAWYAADLGHFDEAIDAARRSVRLDPQNVETHGVLAWVLAAARQYPEAILEYQRAKALKPDAMDFDGSIAEVLLASGAVEQATIACESPATRMDDDDRHFCLALAYHKRGRKGDAERELQKFQDLDRDKSAYRYAEIYAQWGDPRKSLRWLARAEQLRDPFLWLLKVDWCLDPIRNEPGFEAIVARMNFPP